MKKTSSKVNFEKVNYSMSKTSNLLDLRDYKVLNRIEKTNESNIFIVKELKSDDIYKAEVSTNEISKHIDDSKVQKFLKEISCLFQYSNNPFLIKYIGYSLTDFNNLPNITFLSENYGDMTLSDLIKQIEQKQVLHNWNDTQRLKIIYSIASGMAYVHRIKFVYGYLNPDNILLDDKLNAKIGFSLFLKLNELTPEINLTQNLSSVLYMAPEVSENEFGYSKSAADVFSFATIVYLLFEGKNDFFKDKNPFSFRSGEMPQFSDSTPPAFCELITKCWDQNFNNRPSFDEIVNSLRNDDRFITEKVDKEQFLNFCEKNDPSEIPELIKEIFAPTIIEPDLVDCSYQLNNNYKYFIPTATFHLNISPENIIFTQFLEILPPELMIVFIEKGSTFLTVAFNLNDKFNNDKSKYVEIMTKFKASINKFSGKFNVISEPILKIPTTDDVKEFLGKNIIKFKDDSNFIKQIEYFFDAFQMKIHQQLVSQQDKDMKFIFTRFELFQKAIENIKKSIRNSQIELILINQTIIASHDSYKFEMIKQAISEKGEDKACELFLYHGTDFTNHVDLLNEGFDKDSNFYSPNHVYATDNIYYATLFADSKHDLIKINQKRPLLCCLAVYNTDYSYDSRRSYK